jgi:hypothetical protein
MTEESIPELLARLERKHSEVIFYNGGHSGRCCCGTLWPCDTARVVAHARSLEAALREIQKGEGAFSRDPFEHAIAAIENMKGLAGAALGEAQ